MGGGNLFNLFNENFIYFNEISDLDKKIAKKYNIDFKGCKNNLGFYGGLKNVIFEAKNEYVLVLQNDCNLVENIFECNKQISKAIQLLQNNTINIMRLRSRFNVGEGFSDVYKYLKYYKLNEPDTEFFKYNNINDYNIYNKTRFFRCLRFLKKRQMIGRSLYIEKYPEKLFPKYIKKVDDEIFIVDSSVINFTEQSFLISKSFFNILMQYIDNHLNNRTLHGFQVSEIILNCNWWRKQHFKIGVGKGLFSHNRYDDSFRKTHQYYNNNI